MDINILLQSHYDRKTIALCCRQNLHHVYIYGQINPELILKEKSMTVVWKLAVVATVVYLGIRLGDYPHHKHLFRHHQQVHAVSPTALSAK